MRELYNINEPQLSGYLMFDHTRNSRRPVVEYDGTVLTVTSSTVCVLDLAWCPVFGDSRFLLLDTTGAPDTEINIMIDTSSYEKGASEAGDERVPEFTICGSKITYGVGQRTGTLGPFSVGCLAVINLVGRGVRVAGSVYRHHINIIGRPVCHPGDGTSASTLLSHYNEYSIWEHSSSRWSDSLPRHCGVTATLRSTGSWRSDRFADNMSKLWILDDSHVVLARGRSGAGNFTIYTKRNNEFIPSCAESVRELFDTECTLLTGTPPPSNVFYRIDRTLTCPGGAKATHQPLTADEIEIIDQQMSVEQR